MLYPVGYIIIRQGFFYDLSSDRQQNTEEHRLKAEILQDLDDFAWVMGWVTSRDNEHKHVR